MKTIKLIFDENGSFKAQSDAVIFEGESYSSQIELEWPEDMADWDKSYEILLSDETTAAGVLAAVRKPRVNFFIGLYLLFMMFF